MTRRTRFLVDEQPSIAAQWHPTLNSHLDRETIGPGSHKRVHWTCATGHEWQASVHSRVAGSGCPTCAGYVPRGRISLARHSPDVAAQWHPRNDLTPDGVGPGSQRKVWWHCPAGHEYEARIANRTRGTGCPRCARSGVLPSARPLSELPDLLAQVDPDQNEGIDAARILSNDKIKLQWRCPRGHRWQTMVRHRAVAGSGCPRCARRRTAPRLQEAHPELASEWHPSRNPGLAPTRLTAGSQRVVWWKRGECNGEYRAQSYHRVRGTTRCPFCSQRVQYVDLATESPDVAAQWHPGLNADLAPEAVRAGSNTLIWWQCPRGHKPWRAMVAMVFLGHQTCPGCRPEHGVSQQETDLFTELDRVLTGGVQQHLLRTPASRWSLDMLFPVDGHRHAVVEFDGSYWHRDAFDRDLRKALDIEQHQPAYTVVRVREQPLELTRPTDVAVPHLTDPFTAASTVIDHLMALLPWPDAVRDRARAYAAGSRPRSKRTR